MTDRDTEHHAMLDLIKARLHELVDRAVDQYDRGEVSMGRRFAIEVKDSLTRLEHGAKEVTGQVRLTDDPIDMCSDIYRPTWEPDDD